MRICDVLLSIPDFIFALVIVGALGGGIKTSWNLEINMLHNFFRSLRCLKRN